MEGDPVSALCTPALVVDLDVVKRNSDRMRERCRDLGVQLRPHMKTHKTLECADIMTGGSRRCIVVSTLAEACFYGDHGYDDILYAYPLPFDKVERCAVLSERLSLFQVLLDHKDALEQLSRRPLAQGRAWHVWLKLDCANGRERLGLFQVLLDHKDALEQLSRRPLAQGRAWHVWLKLDCANGRAGVLHSQPEALRLARAISEAEGVELTGVYAHCGNTYGCRGVEQIQAVAQETTTLTLEFMEKLKGMGITCKSSIGSTPSCSHPVADMGRLSEVHPGNYTFYDVQQSVIGSCALEDVAVRVLTRVIGHSPHRNQLLIDCGWAGLSLDGAGKLPSGYAVIEGHPDLRLLSMTQEHGRVEPTSGRLDYSRYPLGSLLSLIPYHSCATAAMHPVYHVQSGGRLVGRWTPTRGW